MREVDQALARAFARRGNAGHSTVPPSPHHTFKDTSSPIGDASPAHLKPRWPSVVLSLERLHGDRFLRTADLLAEARVNDGVKVILFTSCHRAEGRTTLVLTLARALAGKPGRTLLVDADLGAPTLARQLSLRPNVGLDDVVGKGQALADALIEVDEPLLWLLPLRAPVANPRAFLASPAWTCVLARIRREFDLVLIDGGPMFAGLSAALLHRRLQSLRVAVRPDRQHGTGKLQQPSQRKVAQRRYGRAGHGRCTEW